MTAFRAGDVVRTHDGRTVGVVLSAADEDELDAVFVDTAVDGMGAGVGSWPAAALVLADDEETRTLVRRLGLRGLR